MCDTEIYYVFVNVFTPINVERSLKDACDQWKGRPTAAMTDEARLGQNFLARPS